MSMPTFPDSGIDLTKEQAFLMLLGSIAMEELALSHIMNAEGEKLQYILGTLPNSQCTTCPSTKDLLDINRSVSDLLERVSQNQLLLKSKLAQVLEAMEIYLPCPTCPTCSPIKSCILASPKNFSFKCGTHLPLKPTYCSGDCLLWCKENPTQIYLPHAKPVLINYNFNLSACEYMNVSIVIQTLRNGRWENTIELPPLDTSRSSILCGTTVLQPEICNHNLSSIAFSLSNPNSIFIKSASIALIEI